MKTRALDVSSELDAPRHHSSSLSRQRAASKKGDEPKPNVSGVESTCVSWRRAASCEAELSDGESHLGISRPPTHCAPLKARPALQ